MGASPAMTITTRPAPSKAVLAGALVLVIVAALAVTWAAGGLDEDERDPLARIEPGDEFTTGQWELTLREAWADVPPWEDPSAGSPEFLVVEVDAVNRTDESLPDIDDSMQLIVDGEPVTAESVRFPDDGGTIVVTLHPRVEARVAFLWPAPDERPADVDLVLFDKVFVEETVFGGGDSAWIGAHPAALATMQVEAAAP